MGTVVCDRKPGPRPGSPLWPSPPSSFTAPPPPGSVPRMLPQLTHTAPGYPPGLPEHRQAQEPQVSSTSSESLLLWVRQAGVGRAGSVLTPPPSGGRGAQRVEGRPVCIHWKNCLMFLIWVAAGEAGSWEGSDLSPQLGSGTLEPMSLVCARVTLKPSSVSAVWVPVNFCAIEFTSAVLLASNLASKILSAGSLVKVGGAASAGVLAGLPWLRLTLSSNAALAGATSTLGSLLGTLNGSYLLGCPAAALTTFPLAAKADAAVAGGALATGAVPVVLGAVGFTGAGIAASSLAAKIMSPAAMANGGRVATGSLVATVQSMGLGGLSLSPKVLLGSAGFALVSLVVGL
ncbi:interferon alpha-inducible protein 27-like protein 2B [Mesoplodon densirostris]|uniref:interferon alpha-inducible protein 27-like protein 2B n=1 Tax=Mesoplodon densirostris TaxID=48708 RepID=UPI0028DC6706|nr:interferon alpha-inducible protein 27-like protein 2B [Mesoplodon densirostris]